MMGSTWFYDLPTRENLFWIQRDETFEREVSAKLFLRKIPFKMSLSAGAVLLQGPADDSNQLQQFQKLIKTWEEAKNDPAHFDPTEILCEMADILEKVI